MLSRVRRAVIDATERRQVPWDHSSLTGDFYFRPPDLQVARTEPAPAATEAGSPVGSDVVVWSVIQGSANASDFNVFLEKYPQSPFAPFAQSRLAALAPQLATSGSSLAPDPGIETPRAASEGDHAPTASQVPTASEERVPAAAVGGSAGAPPPPSGQEAIEAAEQPDAVLLALSEEAPSSGPASTTAPVDVPTAPTAPLSGPPPEPSSGPAEIDTAALAGRTPSADTASAPGSVEAARAVEQALDLSRDGWREVQRALNALKHPAGPEDGVPGRRRRAALQAWQQASGSGLTGHLTASQHARLLEAVAPQLGVVVPSEPIAPAEDTPAAEAPIHECDRLAGQPSDLAHVGPGVEWRDLEQKPALAACAIAMQAHPDEVRFQYQYGPALLRGGSTDDARLWFRTTAEQGYAAAQRSVGHMYVLSLGVARDDGQAASWYRRAAVQRDARSQYLLGMMYASGLGVARDDALAATWLRRAAAQGDAGAQFILGWMYAQGRGLPRDLAQAAAWYRKAAEQGNQVASTALRRLPS